MSSHWSNFGANLLLHVDRRRVRRSLDESLREAIRCGRLSPGAELPSSRSLALDLGVARNTVVEVYEQLVAEGWLTARRGSKTRVAAEFTESVVNDPSFPLMALRPPVVPLDLRAGSPDLTAFPRREWLAASRRAISEAPTESFAYGDPRGLLALRVELAAYLKRTRGVAATSDQIIVTAGIAHAIALLAQVLKGRGLTQWAVEQYGLRHLTAAITGAGFEIKHLPVDASGADVGSIGSAEAVYLTPAHQFPIGVPLAPERRVMVIAWAREKRAWIIEDDYDGEYRYDRQPIGALQAMEPDRVVYLGTSSKSLAPALRLGWMVAPPELMPDLMRARTLAFGYNSSLDQLTLAELLRAGTYDRLLRTSRTRYRRRRAQLVDALQLPGVELVGAAAGLHAIVKTTTSMDERAIVERAQKEGLSIEGLASYTLTRDHSETGLVIGYGAAADRSYEESLAVLRHVLAGSSPAIPPRVRSATV